MGTRTGHAYLYAEYGIWASGIWASGIEQICSVSMNRIANMGEGLGPDCS